MKLKDISRTATYAWDPSSAAAPRLVTGAIAGALDESFSNESQLEIWNPQFYDRDAAQPQGFRLGTQGGSKPQGSITVSSRFNRLAWSQPEATASRQGVIAAGLDTGELHVYDPVKLLEGGDALIFKNDVHPGPIRGLDFNPIKKNLLLSGSVNAELYIFDLNNPGKPIPPGSLSTKINEITSLQWNSTVDRVFAASSSSGYTSVWDLKAGKEIVSLQYGGGAAKGDITSGMAGLQIGKRRGMSDVCWHPDQATRLITSSEDDESPVIMLWDLRNTRAPERILSGHTKGVLSVAWCKQDADLLASCGKDNRTLLWNPQSGDIVGELPRTSDWAFQTSWCPSNPNLLATASFDGHISINSLQATTTGEDDEPALPESATDDDIFASLGQSSSNDDKVNVESLLQAPKWMRRPASATFGFTGLLTSVSNLPGASGKHQSGVVHLRSVVTEESIIARAQALHGITEDKDQLAELAESKSGSDPAWKALSSLFRASSREELVTLLGFSKEEVAAKVKDAVEKLGVSIEPTAVSPPAVIEPTADVTEQSANDRTPTKSSPVNDASSLFGDNPITPVATGNGSDFFSSMAAPRNRALDAITVPHFAQVADSSVAATAGSGPSSIRSEIIRGENLFHIYPEGESDTDKLITQALVLGDFESAVDLCIASDRFADALILAVRGGPELLQSTQKAYFARRTTTHPFLRVFQSIITEDLVDIVQNADLNEWRVIFVVLCTFAKDGDFANLADQLGRRLQFKWQLLGASASPEHKAASRTARQDATLCYLAARNLEHVISIWIDEMREEEKAASADTVYSAHADALQSFMEKVAVFKAATGYVDKDLTAPAPAVEGAIRTFPLAGLYDRFYEYADLLATQGLVDIAAKYIQLTPKDYAGNGDFTSLKTSRDRVFRAAGVQEASASPSSSAFGKASQPQATKPKTASASTSSRYATFDINASSSTAPYSSAYAPAAASTYQPTTTNPYAAAPTAQDRARTPVSNPYAPTTSSAYAPTTSTSTAPASGPYAPAQPSNPYGAQQPSNPYGATSSPYAPTNPYAAPSYQQTTGYGVNGYEGQTYGQAQQAATIPPPPRAKDSGGPTILPGAEQRNVGGWNDVPSTFSAPPKRPSSAQRSTPKPEAITSPFPMTAEQMASPYGAPLPPAGGVAPPPRGGPSILPPPPKGGPRPPSQNRNTQSVVSPPPPAPVQLPPQLPPQQQQQQHLPPPAQHQQHQPHYASPPPVTAARPPPPRGSVRAGPPPPGVHAGPPPPGTAGGPPPARALSPLGPGGVRTAHQALAGPPPPGSRLAGPPPPGRGAPPAVAHQTAPPPPASQPPLGPPPKAKHREY